MEPLISQVLLIGDRLPYLTALFTINRAAAEALKGMDGWRAGPTGSRQSPPVLAEIQKAVARVNKQLAPFEQVRKYRVLGARFLDRAGRADRHHEGPPHPRHGELQDAHRRAVRGPRVAPKTKTPGHLIRHPGVPAVISALL